MSLNTYFQVHFLINFFLSHIPFSIFLLRNRSLLIRPGLPKFLVKCSSCLPSIFSLCFPKFYLRLHLFFIRAVACFLYYLTKNTYHPLYFSMLCIFLLQIKSKMLFLIGPIRNVILII